MYIRFVLTLIIILFSSLIIAAEKSVAEWWDIDSEIRIDVTDYGVFGDGKKDNAEALIQLRNNLIAKDRDAFWTLEFPSGHYIYSNNRWIYGLRRVRIIGIGNVRLQNVSKSPHVNDYNPFPRQGMFSLNGDIASSPAIGRSSEFYITGSEVQTVLPGQSYVTLVRHEDASKYSPGDAILLHGYALMRYGYSPNLREFEWHQIIAVEGRRLTLDRVVQSPFDRRWPDYQYGVVAPKVNETFIRASVSIKEQYLGKPRILLLENRDQLKGHYFYPDIVWVEGITFISNPYAKTSHSLAISARVVMFKDISLLGANNFNLYVRESELTIIENCIISNVVEFDKIVASVRLANSKILRLEDSQPHAIKSGTSVRNIHIENNFVRGKINLVAQSRLVIKNNIVDMMVSKNRSSAFALYNGQFSAGDVDIMSNTILKKPNQRHFDQKTLHQRHTVDIDTNTGEPMLIMPQFHPKRGFQVVPRIVRSIVPGLEVRLEKGEDQVGIVDDVYADSTGRLFLHWKPGKSIGNLKAGSVLVWNTAQSLSYQE